MRKTICTRKLAPPSAAAYALWSMRRLVCLFSLLGFACGGASAEERQLARMRDDLSHVQADHDRFDQRLSSLELKSADDATAARPTPTSGSGPTPALRVVHLNPDGSETTQASSETAGASTADTDDLAPRPVIRVQGGGKRGKGPNGDVVEQTLPDESGSIGPAITSGGAKPSAIDPAAKQAYDSALALVNGKQYDKALEAFAAFLVRYPDHPYAANATYWRGEAYFAQGQFVRAAEQFEGIIARFPLGGKTPDALLKLGICQQKLGNPEKAKAYFDKLAKEYPRSDAARRIPSADGRDGAAPKGSGVKETP